MVDHFLPKIDIDHMEYIVRLATNKWRHIPEYEDLKQIGRIAYLNDNNGVDSLVVTKVKRRVIDSWRVSSGYRRKQFQEFETVQIGILFPEEIDKNVNTKDSYNLRDKKKISEMLNISGVEAFIVDSLADGKLKQEIADDLKISPSRVSQIIRKLKTDEIYDKIIELM